MTLNNTRSIICSVRTLNIIPFSLIIHHPTRTACAYPSKPLAQFNLIPCQYSLQWQEPLNHSPSISFPLPRRGGNLSTTCALYNTLTDQNNHNLHEQWTAHNSLVHQLPRRADFFLTILLYKANQRQNNHNMKNTEQLTIHLPFHCPAGPMFFTYNTRTHKTTLH